MPALSYFHEASETVALREPEQTAVTGGAAGLCSRCQVAAERGERGLQLGARRGPPYPALKALVRGQTSCRLFKMFFVFKEEATPITYQCRGFFSRNPEIFPSCLSFLDAAAEGLAGDTDPRCPTAPGVA